MVFRYPFDPLSDLRRKPKQERSRALVERVLDTTDGLLADGLHPAELSTTAIASAAGVSVGAVYQYFPDTESIIAAVAARHIDSSNDLMDAAVAAIRADGEDPVGTMVDLFAARYRSEPGYRALWFGPHLNERIQAADRAGKEMIAAKLREAFAEPGTTWPALDLRDDEARAAVYAVDSMLQEAFRRDPAGDPKLLEEAKRMMRAYLARVATDSRQEADDGS
jgi:AcrR family transcriptional regulator